MILFEDVTKVYPDSTQALNHFQLEINEGELMTLIGPSGCGKTTAMKMINRLIEPSTGHIYINQAPIEHYQMHELRWNIGYVLQEIALFPHMTIEENIAVVPDMKKWKRSTIRKRTDELMDMVGLDPSVYKERKPDELSGGEQQRVGVIRALAANPDIILMDEPFSALDPISRQQLQRDIRQIQQEIQKTIVFVTHDMDEALALGDRVCLMKAGQVIQVDTPQQLVLNPLTDFVKTFIGERKSPWQTAIDIMADRSGDYTLTLTAYESGHYPKKGTYIIYDASNQFAGAVLDGQLANNSLILENNMTLDEAVIKIQDNQQSVYPVLKERELIGTLTYGDVVAFLKHETSRKDGVIW